MKIKKLPSGFWLLQGTGPCNWAQPPCWPCDEQTLRRHAFSEAGEEFIQECLLAASAREADGLRNDV